MTRTEIKSAVAMHNLTLWQVAKAVGVHVQTIYNWMHDDVITGRREERIRKAIEELTAHKNA
jgi:DNA-binding XRE family transcriptional regulator